MNNVYFPDFLYVFIRLIHIFKQHISSKTICNDMCDDAILTYVQF